MNKKGRIHIHTGDGKGKSTAAVGLCVRAAGAGLRVLFVQFMKSRESGELKPLESLGVTVFRKKKINKFVREMTAEEKAVCREAQNANLAYARRCAPEHDLLVMDEVLGAVAMGMVEQADLLAFLESRPAGLEIVLTGRNASGPIRDIAEHISDFRAEKHPYRKGIGARKGVEF